MLNVTKKLKLFVIYTELLSMIWLRLFIAVIALTISSDLSAWGQPQMQVNSPEGFYDCKGIANGANERDIEQICCLPSQQTLAGHCRRCRGKIGCEPENGCGNTAPAECGGCNLGNTAASYACKKCGDNTSCLGCDGVPFSGKAIVCGTCGGAPAASFACKKCNDNTSCLGCDGVPFSGKAIVCGKCGGTMGGCGRCSGCKDCKTFRCSYTKGSYWPMFHNTGTNCGSAFELPNNTGGPINPGHGQQFYRVPLFSQPDPKKAALQKCYGRSNPASCADRNKSGWIYSTNNAGELVTIEEESGKKSCTCNDGTITCN